MIRHIIDLTHSIDAGMPVYPGTEPPVITMPFTIETHGFNEKKISFYTHTGTHMDAPAHIIEGAATLDRFPAEKFVGKATVLDVSTIGNPVIDLKAIQRFRIEDVDFVLLYTGCDRLWGDQRYFQSYPVLSAEAAGWLASFDLKGIGADMISFDAPDSNVFPIHTIFLEKNILIIENLMNLQKLVGLDYIFFCFPLKIKDTDGSPVRAVAYM